jgi:hypothetical protein
MKRSVRGQLIVSQIVMQGPAFYENPSLIAIFTTAATGFYL